MIRYLTNNDEAEQYDIAILIKESNFDADMLESYYLNNLALVGLSHLNVIFYSLEYKSKKPLAKDMANYVSNLDELIKEKPIRYMYIADANYFKYITKEKPMANLTTFFPKDNYEVTFGINYSSIKYSEENRDKLIMSLQAIKDKEDNNYKKLGTDIIKKVFYPETDIEILSALKWLATQPVLAIDIETYGLEFHTAGIGTISFAYSEHEAIAFGVDFSNNHKPNKNIRKFLKDFFDNYTGKAIYHYAGYDIKVLIYQLYMKDMLDTEGLYLGLDTLTNNFDDTMIIAHLALNSCSKPSLSLKDLALPFAGNYAEEVKDITKLSKDRLLKYNVIDTISTRYVYNKYYPLMVNEQQEEVYETLMKDTVRLLLLTELTGMPVDMDKVIVAENLLTSERDKAYKYLMSLQDIDTATQLIREDKVEKANKKLKTKKHTVDMPRYQKEVFNVNSGDHLQVLLYKVLALPVIELTKSKQPSTKAKVIEDLKAFANEEQSKLLDALIDYMSVNKILTTFIPALKGAILKPDGNYYLHGNFNITGTVSFRLSSSSPNLQQLPSHSRWAKCIKMCFTGHEGTIFCGADFNSLTIIVVY